VLVFWVFLRHFVNFEGANLAIKKGPEHCCSRPSVYPKINPSISWVESLCQSRVPHHLLLAHR
jgi:hypothetical protein